MKNLSPKRLPRGIRKFIRKRKAEIRKSFTQMDLTNAIEEMYNELREHGIKV